MIDLTSALTCTSLAVCAARTVGGTNDASSSSYFTYAVRDGNMHLYIAVHFQLAIILPLELHLLDYR